MALSTLCAFATGARAHRGRALSGWAPAPNPVPVLRPFVVSDRSAIWTQGGDMGRFSQNKEIKDRPRTRSRTRSRARTRTSPTQGRVCKSPFPGRGAITCHCLCSGRISATLIIRRQRAAAQRPGLCGRVHGRRGGWHLRGGHSRCCERPDERVDVAPLLVGDHLVLTVLCLHDVDAQCCAE